MIIAIEELLMGENSLGIRADGYVWLNMLAPAAEIAGEHKLLAQYFNASSEKEQNKSSFSTLFHSAVNSGWTEQSELLEYWNDSLQGSDFVKIAQAIAEARTYFLINQYTSGNITWRNFENSISSESRNVLRLPAYINRSGDVVRTLRKITHIFTLASRMGEVGALLKGDISTGTLTTALEVLADYAADKQAIGLATRLCFIKNIIDIGSHLVDVHERLNLEDYNAAIGHVNDCKRRVD